MRHFLRLAAIAAAAILASGAACAQKSNITPPQTHEATSANYVGQETCATCHDEQAKKFENNPHTKLALAHGKNGVTCESCHGPGKEHAESGDATKIINPAKLSPKQASATCLGCHAGQHANFDRSPHAKANVGCVSCHSVHAGASPDKLLKADQPTLCYQCHTDVKPSFSMPFHHKVNEGLVKCSDCHDAHGTMGKTALRSTADQNAICTKCHAETRGPFVFEHAAVKGEGCTGCHTPHGSQNARLLNMPSINTLCKQCHSSIAADTVHGMGSGSTSAQNCTSCHTYIHGSNMSWAFTK